VATIQIPHKVCDIIGCHFGPWKENLRNNSLEIVFGVHPKVKEARRGDVVLEENKFHICPDHSEYVKTFFVPAVLIAKGKDDSNYDPNLGCWVTVWEYNGNEDQRIARHQVSYDTIVVLYRHFRVAVLSSPAPVLLGNCNNIVIEA